ncbi:MAG: hypothetical protein IE927_11510 [Rhodobacterales bacterium]|nr:hypothetical protein [Rhodobacterales bacterium]
MGATTIQQMADRVAGLMEERLAVRGTGLAEKLRRGRRRLPRRLRAEAQLLAEAADLARNPRLALRIDQERVATAYDALVRHLGALGRAERRRAVALSMLRGVAFSLLAVAGLVAAVLAWRGLI